MIPAIDPFAVGMAKQKNSENATLAKLQNTKNDAELKKVCNDFEAFFMQQILDVSLKNTNIAGEGTGSEIIKGMYTETIAKQSSGTFGISDMLFRFLSENKKGQG